MSGTPGSLIVEGIVRDLLGGGGAAQARVASSSMAPRLLPGDLIEFSRVDPSSLWPGDIVVMDVDGAGLVVHRLVWRDNPLGRPVRVFTKGDALAGLDRAAPLDRLLGRVVSVTRGGECLRPTTVWDRCRCLAIAARHGLLRLARRLSGSPRLS